MALAIHTHHDDLLGAVAPFAIDPRSEPNTPSLSWIATCTCVEPIVLLLTSLPGTRSKFGRAEKEI